MTGRMHAAGICDCCDSNEPEYRLWVNEARTVLVTMWNSGVVEVARRDAPDHTWGPPVRCEEEVVR